MNAAEIIELIELWMRGFEEFVHQTQRETNIPTARHQNRESIAQRAILLQLRNRIRQSKD